MPKDGTTITNVQGFYLAFYFVVSFVGIIVSLVGKGIIKRKRPVYATTDFLNAPKHSHPRLVSMAHREIGNPAMPSADSTWGAIWCTLNILIYGSSLSFFVLPMVMLGRVYFRCHWIGDTIVGALIGVLAAALGFIYLPEIASVILPLI